MAPVQRPSLRELRIMLLHLQSSKDELDMHAFDQKWNQLLPRHHHLHNSGIHNDIATIDAQDITVLPPEEDYMYNPGGMMGGRILNNFQMLHEQTAARPPRMDSRFSELDPALLVHSGQFQSDLFSWPKFDAAGDLGQHLEPKQSSFPANELSLQAELGPENLSSFRLTNGEDEEYLDDKDAFVFVSQPSEKNSVLKGSEADHGARSAAHGKHSPQQLHIAEVHRLPVDPQDAFSKKPLLESEAARNLANSGEVSSSEDGAEELNREDTADKSPAVERHGLAGVGKAAQLPRSVRNSSNDLDGSISPDSAVDIKPAVLLTPSHVSRTEEFQTSLVGSDFSFLDKPKGGVELNGGEKENNNTMMAKEQPISVPSELSLSHDQTQS